MDYQQQINNIFLPIKKQYLLVHGYKEDPGNICPMDICTDQELEAIAGLAAQMRIMNPCVKKLILCGRCNQCPGTIKWSLTDRYSVLLCVACNEEYINC